LNDICVTRHEGSPLLQLEFNNQNVSVNVSDRIVKIIFSIVTHSEAPAFLAPPQSADGDEKLHRTVEIEKQGLQKESLETPLRTPPASLQ